MGCLALVDRWLVLIFSQFVSATLGFVWGFATHSVIFIYVGGFFFSLGCFAATRWGFDRWKAKKKNLRLR